MKNYLFFLILSLIIIFNGCEDSPPLEYIPQNFVEAYLIVGEPIKTIKIMKTQPLADSFSYKNSFITDADVFIKYDDQVIQLVPSQDIYSGYHYPDTTVLVKANTTYNLIVLLKNGDKITGTTTTPDTTQWINKLPEVLYYPDEKDSIPMTSDTIKISWKPVKGLPIYLVRITSLDTLEYGKYLVPPNNEKNARIYRPWERNPNDYNDVTRWGFIPNTETPIVWNSIKWYGLNDVSIIVPDFNFLRWFLQYQRKAQADPLLTTVEGAIGVFGSLSQIRATTFVVKKE